MAQSDQPIYQNLDVAVVCAEAGFPADSERLLDPCKIVSLRVQSGDDASCLNLYQPTQPAHSGGDGAARGARRNRLGSFGCRIARGERESLAALGSQVAGRG